MIIERLDTVQRLEAYRAYVTSVLGFEPTIDQLICYMLRQLSANPSTKDVDGLSRHDVAVCRDFMSEGRKIAAIKHVRMATGLGLADAKHLVERRWP